MIPVASQGLCNAAFNLLLKTSGFGRSAQIIAMTNNSNCSGTIKITTFDPVRQVKLRTIKTK